jgi:hypothetical protein
MGDECPNPYIPWHLSAITGDKLQGDVETKELLREAQEKFEVYHISVDDPDTCYNWYKNRYNVDKKWKNLLGDHYKVATLDNLISTIVEIIKEAHGQDTAIAYVPNVQVDENFEICW